MKLLVDVRPLFGILFVLTGCGRVDLDVSAIQDQFQGKNPIGLFQYRTPLETYSCTAFAISSNRVMTNGHCIHGQKGEIQESKSMHVYFKNPGDKSAREFSISKIVDYRFAGEEDWALLEVESVDENLDSFGPLDLEGRVPENDALSNDLEVDLFQIDPPKNELGAYVIRSSRGKLLTSTDFQTFESQLSSERMGCFVSNHSACENQSDFKKSSRAKIENQFRSPKTFLIHVDVRQGNSGSPLLYQGKVIGILYKILGNNADEGKVAAAQWVPGVYSVLK